MNHAIVFSLIVTPSFAPYPEAFLAAKSLDFLRTDMFSDKFLAYDPLYTDKSWLERILAELPGFRPIEVPPLSRSLQLCGCRQLDFVSAAIDSSGCDSVMSVPSNWFLASRLDPGSALMASTSPDVFSVLLGGCPLTHIDAGGYFSLAESTLPKYSRLRVSGWHMTGLDRGECPSIFNALTFKDIFTLKDCNLNYLNRCGWDPKYQVLYPDALSSSPGDGKPEPFRDIVGICPEYWDKYEITRSASNGRVV